MDDDLIECLTKGDSSFPYPVTPERAAAMIVDALLSDLPPDRRAAVKEAIEEWGTEWGTATTGTALESAAYG